MPVIPSEFVPSVAPQGHLDPQQIQASPADFGGQAGQALEQSGNMLEQHAVQRQQLANETNVNDVYANQFSPAFRDLQNQFMKLEGKDAETQFADYQKKMNELREQFRDNLPNPYQQKLFDDRSTRRAEIDLDGMSRYAAQQTKAWEWNTHLATIGDLTAEGESNYNNPQRLQNVLDRLDDETISYGSKHGWSPEVFEYQRGQNQDQLWSAVIKRQAMSDFPDAIKTYQDQVAAGRISGRAQGDIERYLKPRIDLQQAQSAYGLVTGGTAAQAIAGEARRQGVDPSTALTIWSAEGGVTDPVTKNPRSSATGIFQLMPDTWAGMGGTGSDRLDAGRQIQLGVALAGQNSTALAKDLGRQPQPWEVYLAHQQGMGGAKALLNADPSASAAGVLGGSTDKLTQNGIPANATAGQALNLIKAYVDKHSQMYAANGVPTAQNLSQNYETGLQAVTDLARSEHPGDAQTEERYRSNYIQQMGETLNAFQKTDQANRRIVDNSLTGPNPVQSWQDFMSDPQRVNAYGEVFKIDSSIYDRVDKALTTNALNEWDPPASDETNHLYNSLRGMSVTDRDNFSKLDLMQYYGGLPISQLNGLIRTQQKIQDKDSAEGSRGTDSTSYCSAVKYVMDLAAVSPHSPFYGMDRTSHLPAGNDKWNDFAGQFLQAVDSWSQNNGGKTPDDTQKREIAQQIAFPNGLPEPKAKPETLYLQAAPLSSRPTRAPGD